MTLSERHRQITQGDINLRELVEQYIRRGEQRSNLNPFITFLPEYAKRQAGRINDRINDGEEYPLAGTVLAVKDNIALKGERLSCASRILDGYVSPYTATALQRLIDAGVVVIGKSNLDEFAMGSSSENSAFGAVHHPIDYDRVPGGSSGGSAVAVAAGLATAALGSDTGGSVRQPAAFCGVIGLKPTYGRVSRYGLTAFGSSLDQIGVMSQTVDEMAHIFQMMAGCDPLDNTSVPEPVHDCVINIGRGVEGLKIGLPVEYDGEEIDPMIVRAVDRVAAILTDYGAKVKPCSLPHTKYAISTYQVLVCAEASSNLARYDGMRYGYRPPLGDEEVNMEYLIRRSRQDGFGAEVKRRIMLGTYVLSAGYYDAYYLKAQKVRRLIRNDFTATFKEFDLLLTPTTPTTAFRLGEKMDDPISMYLSDIFTAPASLAGIPAITVPFGADDQGLPIGVQLMATYFREDLLTAAASLIELSG